MASTVFEVSKPSKRPIVWPQWLAAVDVFMLSIVVGMVGGWSSPYLAKFASPDAELPATDSEASWIAAIIGLGRIVGAMFGVLSVDQLGSKASVLYSGIPLALGWSCLLMANSIAWVYVSRVLSGIGMGMYYSTFPLYIGEISYPKIRGALVGLITQGLPVGTVIGNIVGAYTPMWIFSCASLLPNLLFVGLFYLKPESPHYLVLRGRLDEAKTSLEWYNRGVDVTQELETIKQFTSFKKTFTYMDKFREIALPINRKAVMLVNIVYILVQLSGLWTMSFYMEIILKNAGVTVISPSNVVILVGVLGIVAGWVTTYTNDACGRTIMLCFSSLGVAVAFLMLGIDYQLLDLGFDSKDQKFQWLPIISIIMFQMSLAVGIMPVPSTLISEMFPPNIKSMATCLVNMTSAAFAFLTSKTYQPLVDLLTEKYVFWLYSLLMIFLMIYSIVVLPETKGKSLPEIQEMLAKRRESMACKKKESTIISSGMYP